MTDKRVCVAFGTRPEASKMAPVIYALQKQEGVKPVTLVTGQHREQLDQMLGIFELKPDADLDLMKDRQTLPELMGRMVPAAASKLKELNVDYVLVHGDTLTTFAVALAAFFENIPVGHVEAGLRSFDMTQPFPEEANRRLTDVLTDVDLPPTAWSRQNLLNEGKSADKMIITGNTAVDAVHYLLDRAQLPAHMPKDKLVYITMHRRENLPMMAGLAKALADVAKAYPAYTFVYPVHLNPAVRDAVYPAMQGVKNIMLEEPLDFLSSLAVQKHAELIITDSGGIQEEGTSLGKPVVVLRNVTERPEGVEVGSLKLAGNEAGKVKDVLLGLLGTPEELEEMRSKPNPYGDGQAGTRVAQAVAWRLGQAEKPKDWALEPELAK
ncbi:MAG: UDP-N-acetylglucosamine 2-epimerase (non-hydrolyzing) [Trueperaceae bacterium]|nr:UDP-N-acetylglucosamine 2-epimerase (non-hydrolyzing) [Trueperaceae bacterium]